MEESKSYIPKDLAALCFLGLMICLPFVLIDFIPKRDTSQYYLPMINAFAEGRFADAYFPSIPPLFSTFGGILQKITGLPTIMCGKIMSAAFFILSVVPLYFLALLVKDRKTAVCSSILLLFCAKLIEYSGAALLDTGKAFFIISSLSCICYYHKKTCIYVAILSGICLAGLALIRGEGIIFSVIGGLAMILIESKVFKQGEKKVFPIKSLVAAVLFFLILTPLLRYQMEKTGYPVTDSRQSYTLSALFGKKAKLNLPDDPANHIMEKRVVHGRLVEKGIWDSLFKGLIKGMYLPYLIVLLIPSIIIKARNKTLSGYDKLFIGFFLAHSFILIAIVGWWTQTRYIIAALLPLFITCTEALFIIGHKLKKKQVRYAIAGLAMLFSCYRGYGELYPEKKSKELRKANIVQAANWLKANNKDLTKTEQRLDSTLIHYHTGARPIVYSLTAQFTVLSSSEYVEPMRYKNPETDLEEVLEICRLKKVEFLVIDYRLREDLPQLAENWQNSKDLKLLKKFGDGESEVLILGFIPHLKIND